MWQNLPKIFDQLSKDENVRCIILSGNCEKAFTAGLDVQAASTSGPTQANVNDVARKSWGIRRHIFDYQNSVSSIERCEKRETRSCPSSG